VPFSPYHNRHDRRTGMMAISRRGQPGSAKAGSLMSMNPSMTIWRFESSRHVELSRAANSIANRVGAIP